MNQRKRRDTGQAPDERFQPEVLRPLPLLTPDCRDSTEALLHKDLRLIFDGNRYWSLSVARTWFAPPATLSNVSRVPMWSAAGRGAL